MSIRPLIIAASVVLASALPSAAQMVTSNEQVTRELPIRIGGNLIVENIAGDIDIAGNDDTKAVITAVKSVSALDKASLAEGNELTQLLFIGHEQTRHIKAVIPPLHSSRWTSGMRFTLRVPRTVNLTIVSQSAQRIRVNGMRAAVTMKCVRGTILLEDLSGLTNVIGANNDIVFVAGGHGFGNTALQTINGNIEVRAAGDARFQWIAESLRGDVKSNFDLTGAFVDKQFRSNVNGSSGPVLVTKSLTGSIVLTENGARRQVRSMRDRFPTRRIPDLVASNIEKQIVMGVFQYATTLGNILIGEIHGSADVSTGAGEVQFGSVFGDCQILSRGGPVHVGQVVGIVRASTEAGDIVVQSARSGGTLSTGGGMIRVGYAGGDMRLQSGGGDVVVQQASAPISAETQSGDITITVDPTSRSERVTAKTAKGNILINVISGFAADIDATVITSDPDSNTIASDFAGLQLRREPIGSKTKIRATGKVNGGGERLELYAEDGGIRISARVQSPTQQ